MVITATEFKNNFSKYIGLLSSEDIFIASRGKTVAKISNPDCDVPNETTVAAMLEAEKIAKDPNVKGYNDIEELFADLLS